MNTGDNNRLHILSNPFVHEDRVANAFKHPHALCYYQLFGHAVRVGLFKLFRFPFFVVVSICDCLGE